MSILPSFLPAAAAAAGTQAAAIQPPKEYEIDFTTGQLTGRIVEGIGALKVWIWCCLKTPRFRHAIYSWQYGTSFEDYVGQTLSRDYLEADCHAEIQDALMVNPWINGIDNFSASLEGAELHVTFRVLTSLGEIEVSEYV